MNVIKQLLDKNCEHELIAVLKLLNKQIIIMKQEDIDA